jgi:hypothetical protein
VLLVALSSCDLSLISLLARASSIFPGNNHADKSHSPIPRRMRNVSPDFGAGLTSFAAGFVRPDNGLSSRLEISGPQEKQEKRNERAWRTHSKKPLILQNSAFYPPATSLECFQRRFPTDSRLGVSRNTFPVIPDFSVVSFSPRGAKRW